MIIESPFTEARVKMWVRIYHALYLRGVADAHDCIDDEGAIREYLELTWAQNKWGTLKSGVSKRAYRWQYLITELADDMSIGGPMREFLMIMGKWGPYNYFSIAFTISLDFYRKGVKDYLDNHARCDYDAFVEYNKKYKGYFTEKGIRKATTAKIASDAIMMSDYREELDEREGGKYAIPASKYNSYRYRMSQVSKKVIVNRDRNYIRYR